MDVEYRQFKTTDSKTVTELIQNLYREDPSEKLVSLNKIQNTFNSLMQHPDRGAIMVFEHRSEVIGYSILVNFWSNEFGGTIVVIDELYIRKEFRSKGIGSDFIKHLAENRFGGSVALELEVTPRNTRARRLYESIGFKSKRNDTLILDLD